EACLKQFYSLRSVEAGLAVAALNACVLTTSKVKTSAIRPATGITHSGKLIRYGYRSNKASAAHQATGEAITKPAATRRVNSRDIKSIRFDTDAPNTFLIPTSFVRCSAVNAASPNKPSPVIQIASTVKIVLN